MSSGVDSPTAAHWNGDSPASKLTRPASVSELVVEASGEALALLGGDLDVGRGQQVHAIGGHLDLPAEAEHQAGGEVHQAPGDGVLRPRRGGGGPRGPAITVAMSMTRTP